MLLFLFFLLLFVALLDERLELYAVDDCLQFAWHWLCLELLLVNILSHTSLQRVGKLVVVILLSYTS